MAKKRQKTLEEEVVELQRAVRAAKKETAALKEQIAVLIRRHKPIGPPPNDDALIAIASALKR